MQIICAKCGCTLKCTQSATIHLLVNHLHIDLALQLEIIGQGCFNCLWDNVVPFKFDTIDGKNVHLAVLSKGVSMVLPY